MCCRKMSDTPEPKSSPSSAAAASPRPQTVRGYRGPGLVVVRVDVARMQAAPAPQPPSPMHPASSPVVSRPPSPESPETVQRERRRRAGAEGRGHGRDRGGSGQGETSGSKWRGGGVAAAGAGGKGEERGEPAAAQPRAVPFNPADNERLGGSVVADILPVSEDEGEGAGRIAVEGVQRQPTARIVPAATMKLILLEVQRKGECKGRRGRTGAGAAEGGDSGVCTGGREQTGKGGKGQVGASGVKKPAGHQEGKGGKGGGQEHQWPQPQHWFRQLPPGSPPLVSAAVRAEKEREARRKQTARYKSLARMEHQRCRRQAPKPEPESIYRLEMGSGKGRSERQGKKRGQEEGTAAKPVADRREGKDRLGGAAKQRRNTTPSGREERRVEGSEAGRQ